MVAQHKINWWTMRVMVTCAVLIYIFPLYWMAISSIKTMEGIYSRTLYLIPPLQEATLRTYYRALEIGFFRYMLNSSIVATGTMILTLVLAILASYSLARIRGSQVRWLLIGFLLAQMLPAVLLATPIYLIFRQMGLLNNFLGLILANTTLTLPLAVIIMRPIMLQIPQVMEEAAQIDGCSLWQNILYIVVPVIRPGLVVVGTISFLMAYGEFLFAITLIADPGRFPVTTGIYILTTGPYMHEWNSAMAFASLATLPVLLLFLIFQRHIVSGITEGTSIE